MLLRTKKPNSEDWKHFCQWQSFLWLDIFVWWLCLCNLMKWSIGQDGGGQMHKSFAVKIKEVSVPPCFHNSLPSGHHCCPGSLVSRVLKKKKKLHGNWHQGWQDCPAHGFFLFTLCLEDPALLLAVSFVVIAALVFPKSWFLFGWNIICMSSAVFSQYYNMPTPHPHFYRGPRRQVHT